MPNTRASTRRQAPKRLKVKEDTATTDNDLLNSVHQQTDAETRTSIMDNLREAKSGVESLCARIRTLEKENERLSSQLLQAPRNVVGPNGSSSSRGKTSRREIRSLERVIVDLKAARERDRRTIEKIRDKEVERDAQELAGDDDDGCVPTQETADLSEALSRYAYTRLLAFLWGLEHSIELLRRMCDTVDMNTLDEGEECAICMEKMEVGKCYSLPCEHVLCAGCFEHLPGGANTLPDSVQCPHCRKICERDAYETITHTAQQQWDILLEISQEWAAVDVGEIDVGEDNDDEDSSIDDSSVAATESSRLPDTPTPGDAVDLVPEISAASTSADDTGPVGYKSLPSPLKRKRLTELIAQRTVKQKS